MRQPQGHTPARDEALEGRRPFKAVRDSCQAAQRPILALKLPGLHQVGHSAAQHLQKQAETET